MKMTTLTLADPILEHNSLYQFLVDQEDWEEEMKYARNTLWMFQQNQDEETHFIGFALPSKGT
jgi:hypothetical protein